MKKLFLWVIELAAVSQVFFVACVSDNSAPAASVDPTAIPTVVAATPTETSARLTGAIDSLLAGTVDLTRLRIGDAVSSEPEVGAVWSCQTTFGGPGAAALGDWANGDGTFDLTAKPTVDGEVEWPSEFAITLNGDVRTLTGNALPDHATGNYPISNTDDAYQYDRNPNSISAQTLQSDLPANPTIADEPSCLSLGAIGVMLTGSVFFNGLDARGRDAVAYEIQDTCAGHPEMRGAYHYHSLTPCIDDESEGHSSLVGYAMDGFGVYGPRGEDGKTLTNAFLDECHGHSHEIEWHGQTVEMYHYHATWEYPYTVGCYKGTPTTTSGS